VKFPETMPRRLALLGLTGVLYDIFLALPPLDSPYSSLYTHTRSPKKRYSQL